MTNYTNHECHKRHTQATRYLVRYLYYFCRREGSGCRGFLTAQQVSDITSVPAGSVSRIASGNWG